MERILQKEKIIAILFALGVVVLIAYYAPTSEADISFPDPSEFQAMHEGERNDIITEGSKISPTQTWEYLKKASTKNGEVILNAHELAHVVGNYAFYKDGIKGIRVCDPTFGFGCFHGVAEEFLGETGPAGIKTAAKRCKEIYPSEKEFLFFSSCIHGMGHGLATWEALDYQTALTDCDMLDERTRPYCYDGVFMEYSFSAPKKEIETDADLWALCTDVDERYHINCARYQPNLFRMIYDYDLEKTAGACLAAPTKLLRDHCIDDIGFFVAQTARNDTEQIQRMCKEITDTEYEYRCIAAAAGELIFQEYEGWESNSELLCDTLPPDFDQKCHERNQDVRRQYMR